MTRPTFYCSAAHQVGVGEVEGCVQAEVGLHDTPNLLCHVIVHVGTLQRNFPFLPKLQRTLVVSCPDAPLQAACREHLPPAAEGASSTPDSLLSSLLHIPCTLLRSTASGVSPDSQPAHTPGDPSHLTCLIFITPRLTVKIYKEISLAELIFTPQQLQCQQRDSSPCLPPTPTPPELECPPPPWPADSPCSML